MSKLEQQRPSSPCYLLGPYHYQKKEEGKKNASLFPLLSVEVAAAIGFVIMRLSCN
jgi:hypothetical protein